MDRIEELMKYTADCALCTEADSKYAACLDNMLDGIDGALIGENYAAAIAKGDVTDALNIYAEFLRAKPVINLPEISPSGSYDKEEAWKALDGWVNPYPINIPWTFKDGKVDFHFNPTLEKGPVNHEWLWVLSRHAHWKSMARAFTETGDIRFVKTIERQLLDWIYQTEPIEKYNGPGSAWRTIECGLRLLGSWPIVFQSLKCTREFSNAALLLMVASMYQQTQHLVTHPTCGNWLMMETNGIYTFSSIFGEFKTSKEYRKNAIDRFSKELEKQILPDGMHFELSPDYHGVVFNCAANMYSIAKFQRLDSEFPASFTELMNRMTMAVINLSTPGFTQPRTNDCYTSYTKKITERAAGLLPYNPAFDFVNSVRKNGRPPEGETASCILPWAGFCVMRENWTDSASYLLFDVGPLGMSHMHQDKLNIHLYKGNQELIYDDGGGQYEFSPERVYGLSGYSHNTLLVDGLSQNRHGPLKYDAPEEAEWVTNSEFDYAAATYTDGFGPDCEKLASHTREIRFCRPGFFCVSDTVTSLDGQPHSYEIIFQLNTVKTSRPSQYPGAVLSDFEDKYDILIVPVGSGRFEENETETVSARKEPSLRGWFIGRNDNYVHPSTTVSRGTDKVMSHRFTTLLIPVERGAEMPEITDLGGNLLKVAYEGREYTVNIDALGK